MFSLRITVLDTATRKKELREFWSSPVRIGRHPENDLVLAFPFVSAWHAELRLDERGVRLCDLGSSNGLAVDGEQLEQGAILPIDGKIVASIGHIELHIESIRGVADERRMRARDSVQGSIDTDERTKQDSATTAIPIHRLHASVRRLRPLYEQACHSRRAFNAAFATEMGELQATRNHEMISLLKEEFPDTGPELDGQMRLDELTRVTADVAPSIARPTTVDEARQFLSDIGSIIQALARGVADLQEARARQSADLGVQLSADGNPFFEARTDGDVLRLLFDRQRNVGDRAKDLLSAVGSILAHQRGLARGAVEGCRHVVEQFSPSNIERGVQAVWPMRGAALWRRFEEKYEALTSGDLSTKMRELFADAYAEEMTHCGLEVRRRRGAS